MKSKIKDENRLLRLVIILIFILFTLFFIISYYRNLIKYTDINLEEYTQIEHKNIISNNYK